MQILSISAKATGDFTFPRANIIQPFWRYTFPLIMQSLMLQFNLTQMLPQF